MCFNADDVPVELASNGRHEDVCRESVESESRIEETALVLGRGVTGLKGSGPVVKAGLNACLAFCQVLHFVRDEGRKAA